MNVFYLDEDPFVAARYHCDKHVVKMILESAQLLSTAHRELRGEPRVAAKWVNVGGQARLMEYVHPHLPGDEYDENSVLVHRDYYLSTHKNHPSAVWVRSSADHYTWTYQLMQGLMSEFRERYGSAHACERLLKPLSVPLNLPGGFTPPPQAMPDEYKSSDTVEAYRRYYIGAKAKFATWRNAAPSWWKELSMNLTPSLQIIAKQNVIKAKVARPSDLSEKEPPVYFAPGIFDDVTASAFPALEEEGYITKNPKGKFYLTDKGIAEADKVFEALPMENLKLSELQAKYESMEGNKGSKFRKKADAIAAIMALSEGKEEPEVPAQGARKGAGRPKKDGVIRIIQVENPKKPGSKAHQKYSLYRDGMTINEYLAAGGTREDLNWDNDREFIRVEELPEAAE